MKVTPLVLTSPEVVALIARLENEQLPARTLAGWANMGLVVPSVRWTKRRGPANVRVYSLQDVAKLRLVVKLRHLGFGMARTREVLHYVSTKAPGVLKPATSAVLVFDGKRVLVHEPGRADVEAPSGQLRLELAGVVVDEAHAVRLLRRA